MMGASRRTRVLVGLAPLALVGLLAMLPPAGVAEPARIGDTNPRVDNGVDTLFFEDLTAATMSRISGLMPNQITSRYSADGGELLTCAATPPAMGAASKIRYTINGAAPNSNSPTVDFACEDSPAPAQSHTFIGTIPVSELAKAGIDGIITFQLEIAYNTGPAPSGPFIDNNGGTYYRYRLDNSAPTLTNRIPVLPAGSSVTQATTNNPRTAITFRLQDQPLESPLDLSGFNVQIDGVDRTSLFDCVGAGDHATDCIFDYTPLGASFAWAVGEHTLNVSAADATGNAINASHAKTKFVVDLTPPVVTNVTAIPSSSVPPPAQPPGGLPTTGRGVNITVTADVADTYINTKSTSTVFAQLYNTTLNVQTGLVPMKFVSGTKWEAKDVVVPTNWPIGIYRVHTRVIAFDQATNQATNVTGAVGAGGAWVAKEQFIVDGDPPRIMETPVGPFIRDVATRINATITDNGTGVDKTKLKIRFANVTGSFKSNVTGATQVGQFYEASLANPSGDNYTYELPAATDGSTIVYFLIAKDKAGGETIGPVHTLRVDSKAPALSEFNARNFRSTSPYEFRVTVTDDASGVKDDSVKIFYRTTGGYTSAMLAREGSTNVYGGTVSIPGLLAGAKIEYYFEARDNAGNLGNLSSAASPRSVTIDLAPPSAVTITAPTTTAADNFTVSWSATDNLAGVDTYTIQARSVVGSEAPGPWVTIAEKTTATSLDFCGEGLRSYEFRGLATDRAGNAGTFPAAPTAKTTMTGEGCEEQIDVVITLPAANQVLSGVSQPVVQARYTAVSTRTFTPSSGLMIRVLFSPDDGQTFITLAEDLENTGKYNLTVKDLPSCTLCKLRVEAKAGSGHIGTDTSGVFKIIRGDDTADLDGNGLPDEWEIQYFQVLGEADPEADEDGDGLPNSQEASYGTDPQSDDTDGDGASDRLEVRSGTSPINPQSVPSDEDLRVDQYTHYYWAVPGIFLALGVVYFIGLARRW